MLRLIFLTLLASLIRAQIPPPNGVVQCQLDLALLLDGSGSIWADLDDQVQGAQNWDNVRNFAANLVADFINTGTSTNVAAIKFEDAGDTELLFNLAELSLQAMTNQLRNLAYDQRGGRTRMDVAMEIVNNQVFNLGNPGDNVNAPNVVIVLTDGMITPGYEAATLALVNQMKARGIFFIAVGVTNNIDMNQLLLIASNPDSVFSVNQFSQLEDVLLNITRQACIVISPPSPATPTPGPPTTTTTTQPPSGCPAPEYGVAFSAYSANNGMIRFMDGMIIPFQSTYLNHGNEYSTSTYRFTCPCRGLYEFHLTMSNVGAGIAAAIYKAGLVVSPIAHTNVMGAMSTTTIVLCDVGEQVWAEIIISGDGLMSCLYDGNSFYGFTGQFLSAYD